MPMDEKSKCLTAMLTPYGTYIYNVLAMGLADATNLFEICIHQLLQDLEGVLNIADDILVFGRAEQEFNTNVIKFLDRCVDEDIHLNADKVRINTDRVPFFDHILTKQGILPDESKVKANFGLAHPRESKGTATIHGFCQLFIQISGFSFRFMCPSSAASQERCRIHLD